MSGKAATFGGRMMNSVADQVLGQFVANFIAQLEVAGRGDQAGAAGATSAAEAAPAAPALLNGLALLWAIVTD